MHITTIMCNKREGASSTPMKIKKHSKSIKSHNKRDSDNTFFKKGWAFKLCLLRWKINQEPTPFYLELRQAGAITRVGLIPHEWYSYRVRQSVMQRGRWSQTNGWAQWQHSWSTFFDSHTKLYPYWSNFHPLWCSTFWCMDG